MSFTLEVKQELSRLDTKRDCCARAECYGAWLFSKCFTPLAATYISESGEAVRKMAEIAAQVCGVMPEINYLVSRRQKAAYRIFIPDSNDRGKLMGAFGHAGNEVTLHINVENFISHCCYASFLRGAFLSCGMAADPKRGYHVEFAPLHKALAQDLVTFINGLKGFRIRSQIGMRKGNNYVYIRESEQCEELLTYIGASNAAMQLMQVKMYKEVINNINRRSNCETANIDKTYSASARQIAAIARLCDAGKLEDMPDDQRQIAVMRLENPEMSLRELAISLNYTRSAIDYRMKKIMEHADKLPSK